MMTGDGCSAGGADDGCTGGDGCSRDRDMGGTIVGSRRSSMGSAATGGDVRGGATANRLGSERVALACSATSSPASSSSRSGGGTSSSSALQIVCTNATPCSRKNSLHAADRVALAVQQVTHAAQQIDIVRAVIAPAAAALHRADLREAALPEPQHMLRHIDLVSDLADGAEGVRRFFQ